MSTEEILPHLADESLSVGEQLRQTRQDKSLSLEEVTAVTRISRANLQSIEAMDFTRLPAYPFAKGQLMLYAAFLGIDDRSLADRFFRGRDGDKWPQRTPLRQNLRKQQLTTKRLAERTHISSAATASALLLFIACSFTAFCLYFSWNPFAFLTNRIFSPNTVANAPFHPADPATGNGAGQHNSVQLQAFFKKNSQVLVTLDNKPAVEHTYPKGKHVLWEANKQISLEFFQPDSAELQLNGAQIPFPDASGGRFLLHLPPPSSSMPAR